MVRNYGDECNTVEAGSMELVLQSGNILPHGRGAGTAVYTRSNLACKRHPAGEEQCICRTHELTDGATVICDLEPQPHGAVRQAPRRQQLRLHEAPVPFAVGHPQSHESAALRRGKLNIARVPHGSSHIVTLDGHRWGPWPLESPCTGKQSVCAAYHQHETVLSLVQLQTCPMQL